MHSTLGQAHGAFMRGGLRPSGVAAWEGGCPWGSPIPPRPEPAGGAAGGRHRARVPRCRGGHALRPSGVAAWEGGVPVGQPNTSQARGGGGSRGRAAPCQGAALSRAGHAPRRAGASAGGDRCRHALRHSPARAGARPGRPVPGCRAARRGVAGSPLAIAVPPARAIPLVVPRPSQRGRSPPERGTKLPHAETGGTGTSWGGCMWCSHLRVAAEPCGWGPEPAHAIVFKQLWALPLRSRVVTVG